MIFSSQGIDRDGTAALPPASSAEQGPEAKSDPVQGAMRYEALDSLRGVCAILVVAYHFNPMAHSLAAPLVGNAFLFVDFFFVLSGFVISYAYGGRLSTSRDLRAFAVRRFARLYPMHLFALLPYVLLEAARAFGTPDLDRPPFTGVRSVGSLVSNLFLLQGTGVAHGLSWNGPSWSISAEWWTYLLFAMVVIAVRRWRTAVLASAAFGAILVLVNSAQTMNVTYDYGLMRCIAGFCIGACLQRMMPQRAVPAALDRGPGASLREIGVVIGCGAFVALAGKTPLSFAAPLVFCAVVAVFARGGGIVSRLLSRPGFVYLGTLSYGIYMMHAFWVYVANTLAKVLDGRLGIGLTTPFTEDGVRYTVFQLQPAWLMDLATVGFIAFVVATAALAYRPIEIAGRDRLIRWLLPSRKTAPVALKSVPSPQLEATAVSWQKMHE